jgi:hypothetical protein
MGWISTRLDRVWNAQLATSVTPSAARRSSSSLVFADNAYRVSPRATVASRRVNQPPRPRTRRGRVRARATPIDDDDDDDAESESVKDTVAWRHPVPRDRSIVRRKRRKCGCRRGRRVRVRVKFALATRANAGETRGVGVLKCRRPTPIDDAYRRRASWRRCG